jgi:putative oxidoreductase
MKTTSTVSRLLLGLVFTVFGLNGFLNFFSPGPVPPLAGQFFAVLVQSHYMAVVLVVEIAGGLALLLNWMTPLALTVLGPVIFNILLSTSPWTPAGLPPAAFVAILWLVTAYRVRGAFAGLFQDGATARSQSRHAAEGAIQHA